jgi:DNA-binding response OmpR family regulator
VDSKRKDEKKNARQGGAAVPPSVVLVFAEDEPACTALGSLLSEKLGCLVHHAFTLESALEISSTVRIHLVVLATMNRARASQQLRALLGPDRERRAPIVVVVRGGAGGDHLDYLKEGADDALPFLCPVPELLARVERRIAKAREREGLAMSRKYSLAGDLTGANLTDLVVLLEHGGQTGSLDLLTRRGPAQLLFQHGQVKHAWFANVRGRVAFFELMREREGQFEFVPGEWTPEDESSAVEGPNTALLLAGSQVIDEDPEEAPAVMERRSDAESRRIAPALAPDPEVAADWVRVMRNPGAQGEMQLLARDQVQSWTAGDPAGRRLRLGLVTDVACGVHVFSKLATPISLDEIASTLKRPSAALTCCWKGTAGRSLEILLYDQERLRLIVDDVRAAPAVLILAPSYGDFLTFNVTSRTILQRFLRDVPPRALLGVGNPALEGQLRNFMKLGKLNIPMRSLKGSLWKLEIEPRTLIEEAIRHWASLGASSRARAA